jgi:hypothetical protein
MILNNPPYRTRGRAIGWGISMLAHVVLVACVIYLHAQPPAPLPEPAAKRIVFVLLPQQVAPAPLPTGISRAAPPRTSLAAHQVVQGGRAHGPRTPSAPTPAPAHTDVITLPAISAATDTAAPPAPASTPASAPTFDMAAARATARLGAHDGSGDLVTRPRLPPTLDPGREAREDKLANGIERSTRHDCKTAYAAAGLLAIIPLVKDAVTGTGCKW